MLCKICGNEIPKTIEIDGTVKRISNKRKLCFNCSPYGSHNTKPIDREYRCSRCGETDPEKFTKGRYTECKKCRNKYNIHSGKSKKDDIVKYLGGKCRHCGYDKYLPSLDVHHLDPSKKDKNFRTHRYWSWSRLVNEIKNCIVLCRNCHSAFHADCIDQDDLIKLPLPEDINEVREKLNIKYSK
jgi:DNA-directed RNA polymerase subunit RPC12/RpoP